METPAVGDSEFNQLQFEKQLTYLKDSQDSINACCQWCLQNRQHHKKIVNSWLNVLKRVKVEQRLILFYLANDVVQYSKRRNYEYVESWGTALQKATTLVRDERVKHKILRIFKIWEQRGVYGEEFITDLCGLISVTPSGPKGDEPHEFQSTYVINKIKNCSNMEKDTDSKLILLKEHNPKIQIGENLITSLKDRAHVDDVEKELEVYVKHMESYINALKLEIKNRIALISVLRQAETQLEADRKDVKLVAHAYKMFGQRVKTFQKKLEEHKVNLPSPLPSPDINAPSPSPDSDIDLPDDPDVTIQDITSSALQFTNAGYYNPVPPPAPPRTTAENFAANGFSSFIGSNMSFDLQNLGVASLFATNRGTTESTTDVTHTTSSYSTVPSSVQQQPPLPVAAPGQDSSYAYNTGHLPLLPPPMPPFSKTDSGYSSTSYSTNTQVTTDFGTDTTYTTNVATYPTSAPSYDAMGNSAHSADFDYHTSDGSNQFPAEYNVELNKTWDGSGTWRKESDTPESPPMFEKEAYGDPVEYHDSSITSGAVDVDHRVLPGMGDLEDSRSSLGGKDVDHRNLISLTGSPGDTNTAPSSVDNLWKDSDQDYRTPRATTDSLAASDTDYRLHFNIENLNLPPPPPPPPSKGGSPLQATVSLSNRLSKKSDNTESIDMDLSDDDVESRIKSDNLKVIVDVSEHHFSLEPPPPLPDLPDDEDANNFLDEISNDLSEFSNLSGDANLENPWNKPPPSMPPMGYNVAPPLADKMNQIMPPLQMTANHWMGGPQGGYNASFGVSDEENPYRTSEGDCDNWNANLGFRGGGRGGRAGFRGNFNSNRDVGFARGRGRSGFRGGNNFRGRGVPSRGRAGGFRQKGNFRGGFPM